MKKVLCSAALVLVTAGWGYGATITQTLSSGTFASGDDYTFTFNQFDTLGGTRILTDIEILFSGTISSTSYLYRTGTSTKDSTWTSLSTYSKLSLFASFDTSLSDPVNPIYTYILPTVTSGSGSHTAVSSGTIILTQTGTGSDNTTYKPVSFTDYTGTGTINFLVESLTSTSTADVVRAYFENDSANNTSDLSLIYTYITKTPPAVPEPATMLLFGTGLLGLAGVARRRVM